MKRLYTLLTVLLILSLTGCSTSQGGIDGLLSAPKLTEEQNEIHQALTKQTGSNISLKYPKSGGNRSAIVIANIDNEPTDEAIVFFQYVNPEDDKGTVMVEILDRNDKGNWEAVYEFPGEGPVVDRIEIKDLGYDDKPSIIIGYSTLNLDEKQFQIYNYNEGQLSSIFTDKYSIMHVIDLDGKGHNDIIIISNDAETGKSAASLLRSKDGKIVCIDKIEMTSGTSAFVSSVIGQTADGSSALFVDATKSTGIIQTEVVSYSYEKLQNPMVTFSNKLMKKTSRPSKYLSVDIDKDSVVEIPEIIVAPGYEDYDDDDESKLYLTSWNVYKDSYSLEEKFLGFYKISDGYAFMLPENWVDKITVKLDSATGEAVFYKYGGSLGDSTEELLRINVIDSNDMEEYEKKGYSAVSLSDQITYIAKISSIEDEALNIDIETVKSNLYFTD